MGHMFQSAVKKMVCLLMSSHLQAFGFDVFCVSWSCENFDFLQPNRGMFFYAELKIFICLKTYLFTLISNYMVIMESDLGVLHLPSRIF